METWESPASNRHGCAEQASKTGEGRPQIRGGRVVEIEVDGREKGGDVRL